MEEIIYPRTLITSLEHKHLLIDANIIRDAANKPILFGKFFNTLKSADITIVTLDVVKFELLKGSLGTDKYKARETQINDIADITLPTSGSTINLVYDLIKIYGIDGSSLSVTDLFLGSTLMQYKKNIFLMTRDTTDFMQNVFDLKFIINAPHKKGIFTYGVYQYLK